MDEIREIARGRGGGGEGGVYIHEEMSSDVALWTFSEFMSEVLRQNLDRGLGRVIGGVSTAPS